MQLRKSNAVGARAYEALASEISQAQPAEALTPLIDVAAFQRLRSLAQAWPVPVQTVCFECRLAEHAARTDFAVLLLPGEGARALTSLQNGLTRAAAWSGVRTFLAEWSSSLELSYRIPFLCMAFDLPDLAERLPVPCVSLCVDPEFFAKRLGFQGARATDVPSLLGLARRVYGLLTSEELPKPAQAQLEALLGANATTAVEPKHLSVMLGRERAPFRLDVRLRAERLFDYLEQIAWPCDLMRLEHNLSPFLQSGRHVQLNLPVWPSQSSQLDLELFAGETANSAHERERVLELLCSCGRASAAKAAVLRDVWANAPGVSRLGRSWYLKLRYEAEALHEAKAYLALMPRMSQPIAGAL